jgi:hypothetical protein
VNYKRDLSYFSFITIKNKILSNITTGLLPLTYYMYISVRPISFVSTSFVGVSFVSVSFVGVSFIGMSFVSVSF